MFAYYMHLKDLKGDGLRVKEIKITFKKKTAK